MKCLTTTGPGDEPLPDWEIHLRDGFGGPGEALGGVTGAPNGVSALIAFLSTFPELARYPLVAVQSSIADAWTTYETA